jgi:hypothetical protein
VLLVQLALLPLLVLLVLLVLRPMQMIQSQRDPCVLIRWFTQEETDRYKKREMPLLSVVAPSFTAPALTRQGVPPWGPAEGGAGLGQTSPVQPLLPAPFWLLPAEGMRMKSCLLPTTYYALMRYALCAMRYARDLRSQPRPQPIRSQSQPPATPLNPTGTRTSESQASQLNNPAGVRGIKK